MGMVQQQSEQKFLEGLEENEVINQREKKMHLLDGLTTGACAGTIIGVGLSVLFTPLPPLMIGALAIIGGVTNAIDQQG